jgi:hypothetical protein
VSDVKIGIPSVAAASLRSVASLSSGSIACKGKGGRVGGEVLLHCLRVANDAHAQSGVLQTGVCAPASTGLRAKGVSGGRPCGATSCKKSKWRSAAKVCLSCWMSVHGFPTHPMLPKEGAVACKGKGGRDGGEVLLHCLRVANDANAQGGVLQTGVCAPASTGLKMSNWGSAACDGLPCCPPEGGVAVVRAKAYQSVALL